MKKLFLLSWFFIAHFATAQVVCKTPPTQGNEATEATNIKEECNTQSTDTALSASNRNVNVQNVVNVVTSDTVPSSTPSDSGSGGSGGGSGSGATR